MGLAECRTRGRGLIVQMQQRWLQRRQAAIEPVLRGRLLLDGQGQTTLDALQADLERLAGRTSAPKFSSAI